MKLATTLSMLFCAALMYAQDLSTGLQVVNDLTVYPMQPKAKPAYLDTIIDPSFGTIIRRITNANSGSFIVPMYSTVQAWNADESRMILYESGGRHQLLDGFSYQFIRYLDDINPDDLEQIFWDFDNPQILYYLESGSDDFIQYNVATMNKQVLVNLDDITTNCDGSISMGNDVQMMSWDSDVFSFRCNNDRAYTYRISTGQLTEFSLINDDVSYVAPMPGASGDLFFHRKSIYDAAGNFHVGLNKSSGSEHACLGRMANGDDGYFAIAFAQGPDGGCIGDIIGHNMLTGECFPLISQSQGYEYPQSGTHISALTHKNTQGGWVAASMMGYDRDGQSLLDQELVVARADAQGNVTVCRVGHHRSDEDDFDYWGEPHVSISPTGTRLVFGSDWSGTEDGQSVDSYVVELPTYQQINLSVALTNFTATENNRAVHLKWTSTTETNNDYFVVEHSTDGTQFKTLGRLQGAGTTNILQSYQFTNATPAYGVNYYRLKQVDFDGKMTYSQIISINIQHIDNEIFIHPNPLKNITKITLNSTKNEVVVFKVTDTFGREVAAPSFTLQKGINTLELNFEQLPSGIYFLCVGSEVVKFVKMN